MVPAAMSMNYQNIYLLRRPTTGSSLSFKYLSMHKQYSPVFKNKTQHPLDQKHAKRPISTTKMTMFNLSHAYQQTVLMPAKMTRVISLTDWIFPPSDGIPACTAINQ